MIYVAKRAGTLLFRPVFRDLQNQLAMHLRRVHGHSLGLVVALHVLLQGSGVDQPLAVALERVHLAVSNSHAHTLRGATTAPGCFGYAEPIVRGLGGKYVHN